MQVGWCFFSKCGTINGKFRYRKRKRQGRMMEYRQAMEYVQEIGKKGSVPGLDTIRELLNRLGNPQDQCRVIHVAGTNGKGSICTFLEALYRGEGKRVGRYISPVIHDYLERFQINGSWMTETEFAACVEQILPAIREMEQDGKEGPTAFELETAVAFVYFAKQDVDLVIAETGMGGRLDATNVLKKPLCTVFTQIGMDHMAFLGDSVEQIAWEKAGIMKAGCPVISYPNSKVVEQVLRKHAQEIGAPFFMVDPEAIRIETENLSESRFRYQDREYTIHMLGDYQIRNAATAIAVKLYLDGTADAGALEKAAWEGRFDKISDRPLFIKDGAHNIDGARALADSLQKHFTNTRILFIIGVLADKEYEKMMALLCPMATQVYTVTPDNSRALSNEALACCVRNYCDTVEACDTLEDAVERARRTWTFWEQQGQKAVIVAWGSLSYIGQIKISRNEYETN